LILKRSFTIHYRALKRLHIARRFTFKTTLAIFLLYLLSVQSFCQGNLFFLSTQPVGLTNDNEIHLDSTAMTRFLDSLVQHLRFQGYIHATLDSTCFKADTCYAYLYKGNHFLIKGIRLPQNQVTYLEGNDLSPTYLVGNMVDSSKMQGFLSRAVNHLANNGHPFATIRLDSLMFKGNDIYATLNINKGPRIIFDSLQLEGSLLVSKGFLARFLKIKPGSVYNHELFKDIPKKLNGLVYIRQNKKPSLLFDDQSASVLLDLDPMPASRFDFIVGILPSQKDIDQSFVITGDFIAEFHNLLGVGEYNFVQFKRLRPTVVELQVKSAMPYLGKLPFGTHIDFRIFKNQNTNLDVFFDGGLQYLYGGANHLKLFYSNRSSSLIDVDTTQLKRTGKLPRGLDVRYAGMGGGIVIRNTDNIFSPTRGLFLNVNASAGYRRVLQNRLITSIPGFENAYDSLQTRTVQAELSVQFAHYIPLTRKFVFKAAVDSGIKQNERNLLSNELLRIGGSKLLRGFDEESIFTSGYLIFTGELRFLLDRYSFISFPFIDFGLARVNENNVPIVKNLLGVGLGLNFSTRAGIFNIAFASGRTGLGLPNIGSARVHFGFQNIF